MAINFSHPLLLLIIPLAFYPLYLWYCDSGHLPAFRRNLALLLRSLLLLCLILALAGLELRFPLERQSVVFAVDLSASCENSREAAENFIREALKHKKADDQAAVVVFGGNALVDQSLSDSSRLHPIESLVDRNYSKPEQALKLADALLPDSYSRRVVLLSDGRQNDGDALKEAAYLAEKKIRLDLLPLEESPTRDARVKSLEVPQGLFAGEKFPLKVRIESNFATTAQLRLYQDQELIGQEEVKLRQGENMLLYSSVLDEAGFHSFQASIEVEQDGVADNNEAYAFSMVQGSPRLLLVEGKKGEARGLEAVLSSLDMDYDLLSPREIPVSLAGMQRYGLLILCNVPAEDIRAEAMQAIHTAVRDLGKGLIMIGGEDSFGPGGYFNTPVEKALPVYMDLRGKKEIPSLGLVLVIDKSGSMSESSGGYSKVELAKEAAIQATSILGPLDMAGVVAFDDTAQWVVEFQAVKDKDAIQDDIATIRADGGTSIYPALALGYAALKDAPTKFKHIILLTDGQSATTGDYYFLSRRMGRAGITMSTVAVGEGADTLLLEQLAEWGQGRYYFSDEISNIPRIFTKETMKAIKSYLVEESFFPVLTAASPLMDGISAVPALEGYVATTPKKAAQVVLSSHRQDPVLAQWQYGLGRSIAFTTDGGWRWSSVWTAWGDYNHFWGNLISWTLPRSQQDARLELKTSLEGRQGLIQVDSRELSLSLPSEAVVVDPELKAQKIKLEPVAPGRYEGRFSTGEPGVYFINVTQQGNEGELRSASGGITLAYSPEYAESGSDEKFLQALAQAGGGSIISEPREAFAPNLPVARGVRELWPWLLMLAALLLLLDIANRRLAYTLGDLQAWWQRWKKTEGNALSSTPAAVTFNRLRQRKEDLNEQERQRSSGRQLIKDEARSKPEKASVLSQSREESEKDKAQEKDKVPQTMPDKDGMSRLLAAKQRARK